ncbi:Acetyltransferase involved in cellulose biosynthesis, CelD/BcsL family [Devosia crocina]|uniref:Acetyltransferase involved in cellulose biosynthesis, CelD/BcsL family n=1 Tax=Devosia crocina TaxID=429728 RepID=A0A1I7N8J4_9HYPH|nr:Acetyltransferase involved in cellulose biosynthesis, CelD/BcsL family [Devosia crocina]
MGLADAQSQPLLRDIAGEDALTGAPDRGIAQTRHVFSARMSRDIDDVEEVWRILSVGPMESPGQSYNFIRLWIADRGVEHANKAFVVGEVDGQPVALLPLHCHRYFGFSVYTWFPRSQVGAYAPVSDYRKLSELGPEGRASLWSTMIGQLSDADAVYLRTVPEEIAGYGALFSELGKALAVETLYRAEFNSWEECDKLQRSRSRRKHDRQQGDRLDALGKVEFELVTDREQGLAAIDVMFRQRSARFKAQGIRDTFVEDRLIEFYKTAMCPTSGIDVRLHVLRLDGEIVAVRYNVVEGHRMFCLISSMSADPAIQAGSPGKQCLLRVMQTVFDAGIGVFDMGSGFTDEKRHWCNVQIPVRQHYVGCTLRGQIAVSLHQQFQRLRAQAKANETIRRGLRHLRQLGDRFSARATPSE